MASPKLTEAQRKLRELLVQSGVTEQRASHLAQSIWNTKKVARLVSFGAGPKLRTDAERLCAEPPALVEHLFAMGSMGYYAPCTSR